MLIPTAQAFVALVADTPVKLVSETVLAPGLGDGTTRQMEEAAAADADPARTAPASTATAVTHATSDRLSQRACIRPPPDRSLILSPTPVCCSLMAAGSLR